MNLLLQSVTNEKKEESSLILLQLEPKEGILGVLDLIFDYLDFEDLEIMVGV